MSTAVGFVLQITPTQLFGLAPRFGRPNAFETFFEIWLAHQAPSLSPAKYNTSVP